MAVRTRRLSAIIGTAAALALAFPAAAIAHSAVDPASHRTVTPPIPSPVPVGPNQSFVGVVNGATTDARIEVICDASSTTGHPRAGQSVAVQPASASATSPTGFTGAVGKAIGVGVGASAGPRPVLQLEVYQSQEPIPTSVLVPCAGSGVVSFVPAPASSTSRPATVKVTFVSVVASVS